MDEILEKIAALEKKVESQDRQLKYQQLEIEKCNKILRNVNLIELNNCKRINID